MRPGKIILFLTVSLFILLPMYIMPSGSLQPADGPILVIMGYILMTHRNEEVWMQSSNVFVLFALLFWAVTVNAVHYLTESSLAYISSTFQLFYTIILFVTFTVFFYRALLDRRAILCIYAGIFLSSTVPLFVRGASAGFLVRQSLSFNNPNQLSEFALTLVAILLVLNNFTKKFYPSLRTGAVCRIATIAVIALGHYYIFLAASRAGLVGLVCLDTILIWRRKKLLMAGILTAAVLIPAGSFLYKDRLTETSLYKRLADADLYSALADRTEGRFSLEDLSLVFGSGKAHNAAYQSKKQRALKEVHNTLGDVVYSYGLVGSALFLSFIFLYFRACSAVTYNIFVLSAFLPMHISHNLIRFRVVWIFYALVYSVSLIYIHATEASLTRESIGRREKLPADPWCGDRGEDPYPALSQPGYQARLGVGGGCRAETT